MANYTKKGDPDARTFLERYGIALFGPRWQSDMAALLNLHRRTIARAAAGDPIVITQEHRRKLWQAIDNKQRELSTLKADLDVMEWAA